jgi:hypothetical protein
VADRARPYAADPRPTNLVGFLYRDDEGWIPGSWRDSRAGYGNGRFAMDVNVVWVPRALEATERILRAVRDLDLPLDDAVARVPGGAPALAAWLRDPAALLSAIAVWRDARRHFEVRLDSAAVAAAVERSLQDLSAAEQDYWRRRMREDAGPARGLSFLALALDSLGHAVPVVNSDPATDLFLAADSVMLPGDELEVFIRPYPVGLYVEGLGPLVANDAYADSTVRRRFRDDLYHSPRVVWGREVNLLFLGLGRHIQAAGRRATARPYAERLRQALERTRRAVEASGLRHNELWSYQIEGTALHPVRYGTSSDIQLWNVTDLAVRFLLEGLPAR